MFTTAFPFFREKAKAYEKEWRKSCVWGKLVEIYVAFFEKKI